MRPGNIKRLVDDADYLMAGGRHESALLQLLIAVAATSKKVFPDGTLSIDQPVTRKGKPNPMPDNERFRRFVGARIRDLLMPPLLTDTDPHGPIIGFVGGLPDPESVLYEQYRCNVVHEGGLPPDIRFSPEIDSQPGIGISFSNGTVEFSSGLLTLLRRSVTEAPVNGIEFGVRHTRLRCKDGSAVESLAQRLAPELSTTEGRATVLLDSIRQIGPQAAGATDDELRTLFANQTSSQRMRGSLCTNPYGPPFCDGGGLLTSHGLTAVQRVLAECDFVDIAA